MGCANSRLDDLPAVALCRDRCRCLDEALSNGGSFADAHSAYLDSLRALAPSLQAFFANHRNSSPQTHRLDNGGGGDEPLKKPAPPPPPPEAEPAQSNSSESEDTDANAKKEDQSSVCGLNEEETRRLIAHNFGFYNNNGGGSAFGKPPPPPPAASHGSGWDFLNLFDTFERYERLYLSSSEQEAPPEKAKPDGAGKTAKVADEKGESVEDTAGKPATYEVEVTEKPAKEEAPEKTESNSPAICGVPEATSEIQALFLRASDSGHEVLRLVHQRVTTVNPAEDAGLNPRNLPTTLKKLSLWEKKLYCEVKAEEKLRIVHQRKLQELKCMDGDNWNGRKANSTRALLRDLATRLKITFQIVDRISIAINNVRDEELWPHMKELNHRFLAMYKTMLECHKSQHQRVAEIKDLNAEKLHSADLKAAIQLKLEFQTWRLRFFNWVMTQKSYIQSLNCWLTRCLLYEPEETPDGPMPFSPGRLGAPAVFVVCNHWSQAIDFVSEKEVIEAVHGFIARIDALLRDHSIDVGQILAADKEIERRVKALERQEHRIHKAYNILNQSEVIICRDLQQGLKRVFMAVEKFMENSVQVYEEIRTRIEEVGA